MGKIWPSGDYWFGTDAVDQTGFLGGKYLHYVYIYRETEHRVLDLIGEVG